MSGPRGSTYTYTGDSAACMCMYGPWGSMASSPPPALLEALLEALLVSCVHSSSSARVLVSYAGRSVLTRVAQAAGAQPISRHGSGGPRVARAASSAAVRGLP